MRCWAPLFAARDQKIFERTLHDFLARGKRFVGMDIVASFLTDVNLTSPIRLRKLDTFESGNSAERLVQKVS